MMELPADQSFGFSTEGALRERRLPSAQNRRPPPPPGREGPRRHRCQPTVAVGLVARGPCRGVGHRSFLPAPSHAAHGLPFSVTGAVRVGKAGPGIKNKKKKNPTRRWLRGPCLQPGLTGLRGIRAVYGVSAERRSHLGFRGDGEGVIKQRAGFFFFFLFIFNTRESRPAASAEPLGAGANAICLLQGWLPPATPGGAGP